MIGAKIYRENNRFYFQLVRNSDEIRKKFKIINEINTNTTKYKNELILLYKITAHTRDIVDGKGEMDLCWMQLYNWWNLIPKLYIFDR